MFSFRTDTNRKIKNLQRWNTSLQNQVQDLKKEFKTLDKQVDAIADRLSVNLTETFHQRKRRASSSLFSTSWVKYNELTIKGKVDAILNHLGLELEVQEPEGKPSINVIKKKGSK